MSAVVTPRSDDFGGAGVNTPWRRRCGPAYSHSMKQQHLTQDQNQASAGATPAATVRKLGQDEIDFVPSPDEVARRAYFIYVNEGSPLGRHVEHWLNAEAQLIAERNRTRAHGYHTRS